MNLTRENKFSGIHEVSLCSAQTPNLNRCSRGDSALAGERRAEYLLEYILIPIKT